MSLEKPYPGQSTPTGVGRPDPLYRLLTPAEDSDWECAFMDAVITPSTTLAPSNYCWRVENDTDTDDNKFKTGKSVLPSFESSTSFYNENPSDNYPIEICHEETITELEIPVNTSANIPEGTLALTDINSGSKTTNELVNTWTPQTYPETGQQLFLQPTDKSNFVCLPLHLVEGKEHPEQPTVAIKKSDERTILYPKLSSSTKEIKQEPKAEFFDTCNILQWAIDDQQIGDLNDLVNVNPGTAVPDNKYLTPVNFAKENKFQREGKESGPFQSTVLPKTNSSQSSYSKSSIGENSSFFSTDDDCETPLKRKRGRPARETPLDITPKLPRLNPHSDSDSCGGLTDSEVSALKYRRMRDLNNEASKRCRQSRKERLTVQEVQAKELQIKNEKLKTIIRQMEQKIRILKSKILSDVSNPSVRTAVASRLESQQSSTEPELTESMTQQEEGPHDFDAFWSP